MIRLILLFAAVALLAALASMTLSLLFGPKVSAVVTIPVCAAIGYGITHFALRKGWVG